MSMTSSERNKKFRFLARIRHTLHAEEYQQFLANQRARSKKWRDRHIYSNKPRARNGGFFVPRPATRIPDWCAYGEAKIDSRSPWLIENITPEHKAWARELCIERMERRQNNEWRL